MSLTYIYIYFSLSLFLYAICSFSLADHLLTSLTRILYHWSTSLALSMNSMIKRNIPSFLPFSTLYYSPSLFDSNFVQKVNLHITQYNFFHISMLIFLLSHISSIPLYQWTLFVFSLFLPCYLLVWCLP